jgi:hypothetical protein
MAIWWMRKIEGPSEVLFCVGDDLSALWGTQACELGAKMARSYKKVRPPVAAGLPRQVR